MCFEYGKDGINGTLVNEFTPEGIAEKIRETIENDDYYNSLRENCRKEKDDILSVEEYCDILTKEYKKLVVG